MPLKLSIQKMQRLAKRRRGKCLSVKYIDAHTKLKWQCNKRHVWSATPNHIQQGEWCPQCFGSPILSIANMKAIARYRGGKCLSSRYLNSKTKLKWQCAKGHVWPSSYGTVNTGSWCPYCAGYMKLSLKDMKALARQRGGQCLARQYIDSKTNLKWQCKHGHIWVATPSNISKDRWCPECSAGISERICRRFFEILFKLKFPKTRPAWLITADGQRLELDGYSSKIGLAFEYQGEQHYRKVKRYQQHISLVKRKLLDKQKKNICNNHGVVLIRIPFSVEYDEMGEYIIKQCKKLKIQVPFRKLQTLNYKLFNLYSNPAIEELKSIAKERGGKCLSGSYLGVDTKLKWQCKKWHVWENSPYHIKSGQWCPVCAGNMKLSIEDMQKYARIKHGKCISKRYVNNNSKLKWQCKFGHIWDAKPSHIKEGHWCPFCVGLAKSTIKEMNKLAKVKGGACLSNRYINTHTKLKWMCKKKHIWWANPSDIKRDTWCPKCARNRT